jgi:hypothetical protein
MSARLPIGTNTADRLVVVTTSRISNRLRRGVRNSSFAAIIFAQVNNSLLFDWHVRPPSFFISIAEFTVGTFGSCWVSRSNFLKRGARLSWRAQRIGAAGLR